MVGVAQLASAPDCGSGGRGFESHHPPFRQRHTLPVVEIELLYRAIAKR